MGGFGHHVRWMALLDKQFQKPESNLTTEEKVEYILGIIYVRTAKNWINLETQHSVGLNDLIYFNHQLDKENRIVRLKNQHNQRFFEYSENTKFLCCTCDPQIALNTYKILNPSLNGWTSEEFLERVGIDNKLSLSTPVYHANTFIIDNNILHYNNVLDKNYYHKLINYLELDDNYKSAAAIHTRWQELRRTIGETNSA